MSPRLVTPAAEPSAPGSTGDEGDGWVTTESGLKYMDDFVGKGEEPKDGGLVTVNYIGRTYKDGRAQDTFDNSYKRGFPFKFVMGQGKVIPGWEEGLKTMREGGRRKLVIPPELAYGDREMAGGMIPANSELYFECELVEVGAAGSGALELFLIDARITLANTFSNKFFTAFFIVWLITFLLPKEVLDNAIHSAGF